MLFIASTVALTIGLFEWWQVFSIEVLNDRSAFQALSILPPTLQTNPVERLLFCTILVLGGLLRISYALGRDSTSSWLVVIFSHLVGGVLLWNLAFLPHFNTNNLSFVGLVYEVLTGGHDIASSLYLFAMPATGVFFWLCGPGAKGRMVHWQHDREE